MIELWLNFKNEKGEAKRVLVEGEKFVIGRTPDNDLQISLGNLSRQHAKIERFGDVFVVSDCGSSNGTTLNDENLENPIALQNGDLLNLGGAVEIEIELISDKAQKKGEDGGGSAGSESDDGEDEAAVSSASAGSAKGASASSSSSSGGGSSLIGFFIIAPILGIIILLVIGGIILLARGKKEPEANNRGNIYTYPPPDDDENVDSPTNQKTNTPEKTGSPTPVATTSPGSNTTPQPTTSPENPTPGSTVETTSTPTVGGDAEKINKASALFLRRIAQNDASAFLTDKQIALVSQRITQFKGSGALADNIKNAKKNAAEIQRLAASKNLKPQLLANLALTKLGNQRGDVVAASSQILEDLSNIIETFGADFANECLLVVAAYSNGTKGESLQTTAGILGKNFPFDSPQRIRSLWFFKDNDKLNGEQFDFALRYLAIGTITQNPKDFNVQAEALVF